MPTQPPSAAAPKGGFFERVLGGAGAGLAWLVVLAAAWPGWLGNHLSALFFRLWVDGPQWLVQALLKGFWTTLGVSLLVFADLLLMFYFSRRGQRFLRESHVVAALYGPGRRRALGWLGRALGWVLLMAALAVGAWPAISLALIEPQGFLMIIAGLGLGLGLVSPQAQDWPRRRWLFGAALSLSLNQATGANESELAMGRLLGAGLLAVVAWLLWRGSQGWRRPLSGGGAALWFLLAAMTMDRFTLSLGLLVVAGGVAWRSRLPRPLTGLGLAAQVVALGGPLLLWHVIRVNPPVTAPEAWASGAPGEGASRLVASGAGSVAGLDQLGRFAWVRRAQTPQSPLTVQLPRNVRVTGMGLAREDILILTGGAPVGVNKEAHSVAFDALNEVLFYGVRNGLKLQARRRDMNCGLLGGVVGWSRRRAFLLCLRPHGLTPVNLQNGDLGEFWPLAGAQRPGSTAVSTAQGLLVSEGPLGAGLWWVPLDRGGQQADTPRRLLLGPLGPLSAQQGASVAWAATTPHGSLWRVDTSGHRPLLAHYPAAPGTGFWRPTALARVGGGFVVLESLLASGVRGLRPGPGGLTPDAALSFPAASGVGHMALGRDRLWLATPRRVYGVPLANQVAKIRRL